MPAVLKNCCGYRYIASRISDRAVAIHKIHKNALGAYLFGGRKILIHGNTGYLASIHMNAYQNKKPVMVIDGNAGSFLGEYQAGGIIVVLGIHADDCFFTQY